MNNYSSLPLPDSIVNARAIKALLEKNEDKSSNFSVQYFENIATKADLKAKIIELFSGGIVALLYFSGRGFTSDTGDFLVTADFHKNDPGLSVDEILRLASASSLKNKILIFDCHCAESKYLFSNPKHAEPYLNKGMTILTSATDCDSDDEIKKHGTFTSLLIEALKGGASDVIGRVTPGSLYAYVDKAQGSWGQRPVFKTNVTEFISLRTAATQIAPSIVRNLTLYFPSPDAKHALDPSHEDTNVKERNQLPVEPYADAENVRVFKELQKLQSMGLVVPHETEFMYFAAMKSKSCKLTPLGQHYWRLVNKNEI